VQLDSGRATIKKVSDALLDEVAGVFSEHMEMTKVEIQGHTGNKSEAARQKNRRVELEITEKTPKK
jgi:OmpA-OmpF porin, OOP family